MGLIWLEAEMTFYERKIYTTIRENTGCANNLVDSIVEIAEGDALSALAIGVSKPNC